MFISRDDFVKLLKKQLPGDYQVYDKESEDGKPYIGIINQRIRRSAILTFSDYRVLKELIDALRKVKLPGED